METTIGHDVVMGMESQWDVSHSPSLWILWGVSEQIDVQKNNEKILSMLYGQL